MFRTKFRIFLTALISIFLFFSLAAGCVFLWFFPQHPVNVAIFKVVYEITPAKKVFLDFYSPARRDIQNNHIPAEVNEFLIAKTLNSNDKDEISAIVDLYVLHAQKHHVGYFEHIQDRVNPKIIEELVKQLENGENLSGKLMLLEEVRSNMHLGKGSVGFSDRNIELPKFTTAKDYEKWFDEKAAPIVIPAYKQWWNSNLSWEEKRKINPLQNTNISVSYCCG